jgi:hypothetical protein
MNLELGYLPAETAGECFIQRVNAWEAPRLPGLDHTNMRRWASSPTWVPPESQLLVRHRSVDGHKRITTNDRRPPQGFVIEYDLGLVHSFAQPGTRRLITNKNRYFCTPFEGVLHDDFEGLGYVEEAALPMLDVLELRLDTASGEQVLVAGPEDPLFYTATAIETLGFIEGYPINPRRAPKREIDWGIGTLRRRADPVHWRHSYELTDERTAESVALGGLWTRAAEGLMSIRLDRDGHLSSDLLPPSSIYSHRLRSQLRWAAAPLSWPEGRPRTWAARAVAARAKRLVDASTRSSRSLPSGTDILLGYARRDPSPGWSPLFSATHPALADQYVTRSELEATDMGYTVEGILGYVIDRFADRSPDALPREIKWASHFGHRRRYVEGFRP